MKEIDFIPQWYKAGRERKQRYIRRYVLMAALFTLMLGWGFVVNGHISHVSAEVQEIQTAFEKGQIRSEQAAGLQARIAEMKEKATLLDKIESRTKMTAILGELSYLIGENVILSNLSLQNELIRDPGKKMFPLLPLSYRLAVRKRTIRTMWFLRRHLIARWF